MACECSESSKKEFVNRKSSWSGWALYLFTENGVVVLVPPECERGLRFKWRIERDEHRAVVFQ